MTSPSRTLRDRLILAAGVTLLACGGSTSTTTSSTAPGAGGSSSAGGSSATGGAAGAAGASGASAGSAGGGAGPTATCHDGAPCAVDEWCGYATGVPQTMPCGGCGIPNDRCACSNGTFACGKGAGAGSTYTVCLPNAGSCLDVGDPSLLGLLSARFGPGCPPLSAVTSPATTATASDGAVECCYGAAVSACLGRPLVLGGESRVARLRRRTDWTLVRALPDEGNPCLRVGGSTITVDEGGWRRGPTPTRSAAARGFELRSPLVRNPRIAIAIGLLPLAACVGRGAPSSPAASAAPTEVTPSTASAPTPPAPAHAASPVPSAAPASDGGAATDDAGSARLILSSSSHPDAGPGDRVTTPATTPRLTVRSAVLHPHAASDMGDGTLLISEAPLDCATDARSAAARTLELEITWKTGGTIVFSHLGFADGKARAFTGAYRIVEAPRRAGAKGKMTFELGSDGNVDGGAIAVLVCP